MCRDKSRLIIRVLEKKKLGIIKIALSSKYRTQELCIGFIDDINFNIDRSNTQQRIQEILPIYNEYY